MHPIQQKIYKLFKQNQNKLPSYREIAKVIGVASTNTVAYHIKELKEKGYLSITERKQEIIPLTLRSILHLEERPGVYVLLKGKKPFYVGATHDIKKDLTSIIANSSSKVLHSIKESIEEIAIAFHIIDNETERLHLHQDLIQKFKSEGIELSNE